MNEQNDQTNENERYVERGKEKKIHYCGRQDSICCS